LTLTLAPNQNPNTFQALNEIVLNKHSFLNNNQRTLTTFKVANIKELVISLYEKEIKVELIVKDEHYDRSLVIMKQSCTWQ
jgi:hypothetical protein